MKKWFAARRSSKKDRPLQQQPEGRDKTDAVTHHTTGTNDKTAISGEPHGIISEEPHGILKEDKGTQTEPQEFEETDFVASPPPFTAKKNMKRAHFRKYHSVDRVRHLRIQKVSIGDSEDEEDDTQWINIHHTMNRHTLSFENFRHQVEQILMENEDLKLKAEMILYKKLVANFTLFMMNKSVTAVDLGYREVKKKQTHLRCIKLWVNQKIPEDEVKRKNYIPKMIDGCPVDKVIGNGHLLGAEEEWLEECRNKRRLGIIENKAKEKAEYRFIMTLYPPVNVKAGESIGQHNNPYVLGTIGFILTQNSNIGILTAGQTAGRIGTRIVSPGLREGGGEGVVRNLAITTTLVVSEEVDCAFARMLNPVHELTTSIDGKETITGTGKAQVGDLVKFKGASTGKVQLAYVRCISWEGEIDGMMWRNQIQLSIPIEPGDAGAVLVKESTNEVVGMLFANANKTALANHIDAVLASLNANINNTIIPHNNTL